MRPQNKSNLRINKGDRFFDFFSRVFQWVSLHQVKFYAVILAALLGLGGYGVWTYLESQKANELAAVYYQASTASGEQAIQDWNKLISQKPYGKLLSVAELQLAALDAEQNKYEEAAKKFEQASKKAPAPLNLLAEFATASVYENAQQYENAEKVYQAIAKQSKSPFQAWARLGLARSLSKLNRQAEAKKIFEELSSDSNASIQSAAQTALLVQGL